MTGEYWDYINSYIISKVFGGFYQAKFNVADSDKGTAYDRNEWRMSVEEFFRSGELISIRFFTYSSGGDVRHYYWYSGFNVAGPQVGSFTLPQLFGQDNLEVARFLKGYCDLDIRAVFTSFWK